MNGPSPGGEAGTVQLKGVGRRYRIADDRTVDAVVDVTLSIASGAAVALVGPSGSGKSTLLQLVGALDRPDTGVVTVGGVSLGGLSRRQLSTYRRGIGFVFQRFNLLPALTVIDNVVAPVLPFRTSFDKHERARQLLSAVGLAGRERSLPSRLSGGEQQRVAIARALINEPALLLADEPTGNLDSRTGREILDLLADLRARRRATLLIATHDPHVAEHCERVVRLHDGRVSADVAVGSGTDVAAVMGGPPEPAGR